MQGKSRRILTQGLDLLKHAHLMVLYSTKPSWKAVVTNNALMEGEYLPQSIKSTSTWQCKKSPAKTAHFCSAPPLLRAGCTAVSACIYFRHDFSLQKRSNLLLWLRASPFLLALCRTDRLQHWSVCAIPLWQPGNLPLNQTLLKSCSTFVALSEAFYTHLYLFL